MLVARILEEIIELKARLICLRVFDMI